MSGLLARALPLAQQAWVQALGFLLGGLLLAYLARLLVRRIAGSLARRTRNELDDRLVELAGGPAFTSLALLGAELALLRLSPPEPVPFVARGLLVSALVVLWTQAAMRAWPLFLAALHRSHRVALVQPRTLPLFGMLGKLLLGGGALYAGLLAWKVDVTGLLASAGVLGLAVGFAAKDTLANFIAGIFIIADAPYKLGDVVVLEGGVRGRVTEIGLRSTRILTRDEVEVILPNASMANSTIVNESGGPSPRQRLRASVGVAYGSELHRVREVLLEAARSVPLVLDEPSPQLRFVEMADSALVFEVHAWIDGPGQREEALDQLNVAIYEALQRAGITIPFPQQDLYVKEWPAPPGVPTQARPSSQEQTSC